MFSSPFPLRHIVTITSSHSKSVSHPSESSSSLLSLLRPAGDIGEAVSGLRWVWVEVTDSDAQLKALRVLSTFSTVAFLACIVLQRDKAIYEFCVVIF